MYNATAYELGNDGKTILTVSVVEVKDGHIIRGNGLQCTGLEGTSEYEAVWLAHFDFAPATRGKIKVFLDDCKGYRNALRDPKLPKTTPIKTISFHAKN